MSYLQFIKSLQQSLSRASHFFHKVVSSDDVQHLGEEQVLWRVSHPRVEDSVTLRAKTYRTLLLRCWFSKKQSSGRNGSRFFFHYNGWKVNKQELSQNTRGRCGILMRLKLEVSSVIQGSGNEQWLDLILDCDTSLFQLLSLQRV